MAAGGWRAYDASEADLGYPGAAERVLRAAEESGRVVAFTSDAVHGEVAYGASKAALERIIVAAAELGPLGITVNAINPGPTDTGWSVNPSVRRGRTPVE